MVCDAAGFECVCIGFNRLAWLSGHVQWSLQQIAVSQHNGRRWHAVMLHCAYSQVWPCRLMQSSWPLLQQVAWTERYWALLQKLVSCAGSSPRLITLTAWAGNDMAALIYTNCDSRLYSMLCTDIYQDTPNLDVANISICCLKMFKYLGTTKHTSYVIVLIRV